MAAFAELGKSDAGAIADLGQMSDRVRVSNQAVISRAKRWVRSIKRDVVALWLASRDSRVPWYAKAVAAAVAAYALAPIDLIPDFIPVLGYLDDLIIVPLGILLAVRLIPEPIMADLRMKAMDQGKPTSKAGLLAVILIWVAAIGLTVWLLWPGNG